MRGQARISSTVKLELKENLPRPGNFDPFCGEGGGGSTNVYGYFWNDTRACVFFWSGTCTSLPDLLDYSGVSQIQPKPAGLSYYRSPGYEGKCLKYCFNTYFGQCWGIFDVFLRLNWWNSILVHTVFLGVKIRYNFAA